MMQQQPYPPLHQQPINPVLAQSPYVKVSQSTQFVSPRHRKLVSASKDENGGVAAKSRNKHSMEVADLLDDIDESDQQFQQQQGSGKTNPANIAAMVTSHPQYLELQAENETLLEKVEELENNVKTLVRENRELMSRRVHEEASFRQILKTEKSRGDKVMSESALKISDRDLLLLEWVKLMHAYELTNNFQFIKELVIRTAVMIPMAKGYLPEVDRPKTKTTKRKKKKRVGTAKTPNTSESPRGTNTAQILESTDEDDDEEEVRTIMEAIDAQLSVLNNFRDNEVHDIIDQLTESESETPQQPEQKSPTKKLKKVRKVKKLKKRSKVSAKKRKVDNYMHRDGSIEEGEEVPMATENEEEDDDDIRNGGEEGAFDDDVAAESQEEQDDFFQPPQGTGTKTLGNTSVENAAENPMASTSLTMMSSSNQTDALLNPTFSSSVQGNHHLPASTNPTQPAPSSTLSDIRIETPETSDFKAKPIPAIAAAQDTSRKNTNELTGSIDALLSENDSLLQELQKMKIYEDLNLVPKNKDEELFKDVMSMQNATTLPVDSLGDDPQNMSSLLEPRTQHDPQLRAILATQNLDHAVMLQGGNIYHQNDMAVMLDPSPATTVQGMKKAIDQIHQHLVDEEVGANDPYKTKTIKGVVNKSPAKPVNSYMSVSSASSSFLNNKTNSSYPTSASSRDGSANYDDILHSIVNELSDISKSVEDNIETNIHSAGRYGSAKSASMRKSANVGNAITTVNTGPKKNMASNKRNSNSANASKKTEETQLGDSSLEALKLGGALDED